jgi:hypothetical protein
MAATAPTTAAPRQDAGSAATAPATTASLAATVPDTPPKQFFPKEDEAVLERYGGRFVPTGEGLLFVRLTPVDNIYFDNDRVLTEHDIAVLFPVIQRMDPLRGGLRLIPMTDRTVELLNRLRSMREFNLGGSNVTMEGLRKLRLKPGKELTVPANVSAAERRELGQLMPGVTIR